MLVRADMPVADKPKRKQGSQQERSARLKLTVAKDLETTAALPADTEWRLIPGLPPFEVSQYGVVRRRINSNRPNERQYRYISQHLYSGYLGAYLNKKKYLVHRLVYLAFHGPLIEGLQVCHLSGDRRNNYFRNLDQVTPKENNAHKIEHGTIARGMTSGRSVYDDDTIRQVIKELSNAPVSETGRLGRGVCADISEKHGVSRHVIYQLFAGKTWKHLQ